MHVHTHTCTARPRRLWSPGDRMTMWGCVWQQLWGDVSRMPPSSFLGLPPSPGAQPDPYDSHLAPWHSPPTPSFRLQCSLLSWEYLQPSGTTLHFPSFCFLKSLMSLAPRVPSHPLGPAALVQLPMCCPLVFLRYRAVLVAGGPAVLG